MRLLLEKGARSHGALRAAAENGHDAVVKLLLGKLETDFVLNEEALGAAAENGHEAVVRLLLTNDTDLESALKTAVEDGRASVVRLLLDKGAVPHKLVADVAAANGYEVVAMMLLEAMTNYLGREAFMTG